VFNDPYLVKRNCEGETKGRAGILLAIKKNKDKERKKQRIIVLSKGRERKDRRGKKVMGAGP